VLDNFRKADKDDRSQDLQLREAPLEELVDIFLFFEQNHPLTSLKIRRLVDLSVPSSFKVMYRIFPDYPRDANDIFFAHATIYLMALGERRDTVEWLPAWLSPGKQGGACVDEAIGFMIRQCLTYFGNDDSRRVILLTAAALRRVQKLLFLASEAQWRQAEIRHFIYRYLGPEQQWNQFVASPEGQAIGMLRANGITATSRFVTMCSSNDGRFNAETGKIHLKGLWQMECALLKAMPNYAKLCDERALGDFQMTEASCVTYDALGHMLLCLLTPFPRWRSYIQENHRDELEHLASMGLWSAREMLGIGREAPADASDAMFADRFFFGDTELFNTLRQAYAARP
jgi:hypothetical protein